MVAGAGVDEVKGGLQLMTALVDLLSVDNASWRFWKEGRHYVVSKCAVTEVGKAINQLCAL